MQRQRGGLVPLGEVIADLPGPVQALRDASPQAQRSLYPGRPGKPACQRPRSGRRSRFHGRAQWRSAACRAPTPATGLQYKRVNGPFKLIMTATGDHKLPFGNLPRLLLAWVCTEAVRTGSREIVSWVRSLSDFMRSLGINSDQRRRSR